MKIETKVSLCVEVLFDNTHHIYENYNAINLEFKNQKNELNKTIFNNRGNLIRNLLADVKSNLENKSTSNEVVLLLNQIYPKLTSDCLVFNYSSLKDEEKVKLLDECFYYLSKKLKIVDLNDDYIALYTNLTNYNRFDYNLFQHILKKISLMISTFSLRVVKDFFFLALQSQDERILTDGNNKNYLSILKSYILNTEVNKEAVLNSKEMFGILNKYQLSKIHNAFFKLSKNEKGNIDPSFKLILLKSIESSAFQSLNYEKDLKIIYNNYLKLGLNK
jgi:hypothetical protein